MECDDRVRRHRPPLERGDLIEPILQASTIF